MENLIIGLQIKPTIELTHKGDNLKAKFLVEDIEDVYEYKHTIVKYYSSEFNSTLTFHAEETAECIKKHLKLALELKNICLNMLNELTSKYNDKVEDKRENLSE